MYGLAVAETGYGAALAPSRTPDATEYEIFVRVTRALGSAKSQAFPALAAALHDNQKLWLTLAAAVADPENALPTELRAKIFYLAEFTRAQTRRILYARTPEADDIEALIDVNTAVMRGLRGRPETDG